MNVSFDSIVLSALVGLGLWVLVRLSVLKKRASKAEAELKLKEIIEESKRKIDQESLDELVEESNRRRPC